MFASTVFLGVDLYTWAIILGIVVAIFVFRILCDRQKMPSKVFNFAMICGILCIVTGYLCAILFQSFYHYLATGQWEFGVGATFFGGLIGGAVGFLLLYFIIGNFVFHDKENIKSFPNILCSAAPAVAIAHSIGRIGCLCAGCCYGKRTDSVFGVIMSVDGCLDNRLPVQLYESIFLFCLFLVLFILIWKRKTLVTAEIYLISYGIWRFFIEYMRDDNRGSSGISWLTPSQLTAILLIILGIAMLLIRHFHSNKCTAKKPASTMQNHHES